MDILVVGPAEGVKLALTALADLHAKGYCGLLGGDDFTEGAVVIMARYEPPYSITYHTSINLLP